MTTPALKSLGSFFAGASAFTWPARPQNLNAPRKESDAHYVHFLHYLCEAAGLVRQTRGRLKPTPQVAQWLQLPAPARMDALFGAAFEQAAGASLWQAFRLPGWRTLASPLVTAHGFATLARQVMDEIAGRTWRSARLALRMIEPVVLSDDPDTQPETLLRALLTAWAMFGRIEVQPGAAMRIRRSMRAAATDDATPASLLLLSPQPNRRPPELRFEVPLQGLSPMQRFDLCDVAAIEAATRPLRFTLTRDTAQRAMTAGATAESILSRLESVAQDALPVEVGTAVRRWARELRRVRLETATLLEVSDADLMTDLTRQRGVRQCLAKAVSPRMAIVRADRVGSLRRRLQRRGLLPMQTQTKNVRDKGFDQAEEAHLCLAAMLCHASPTLPASLRPPYAVVEAARQRLSPRDRAMLAQLLETFEATLADAWPRPAAEWRFDAAGDSEQAQVIREALQSNQPLRLIYTDAAGETTDRVVDPLRLEQHGIVAYLIAFCHASQAERMFRLNRIQFITLAPALPGAPAQPTMPKSGIR